MTVLDTAREVLKGEPVCEWCLGRCFADTGSGISTAERGHALRVACAMEADEAYEPIAPTNCWVCGGIDVDYEAWAQRAADALAGLEFETFQLGTRPPNGILENDRALRRDAGLPENAGRTFNAEVNREVANRLTRLVGASKSAERPDVVLVLDFVDDTVTIRINPVYLYGRYRKLESGVSQRVRHCSHCDGTGMAERNGTSRSCKFCDGTGRRPSVEELVAWRIRDLMDAANVSFHAAGREADDVLVLGTGRPFALEVKEPHRRLFTPAELEAAIIDGAGGTVDIGEISFATADVIGHVTQQAFRQRFQVTMAFADPIDENAFRGAVSTLESTPIRHPLRLKELAEGRRPHETVRSLQNVSGERLDEYTAFLAFEIEPGLDPASIATGDGGWTEPNVAELLETDVEVTKVAIVSVRSRDGQFGTSPYLLDRPRS
jgi:tRNA pseudouridine synthase 10